MKKFLAEVSLFRDLKEEEYALLLKASKKKSLKAHEDIFKNGDNSDYLYLVKEGLVKLFNQSKASKKEETVCVIKAGSFFCLSPVLTNKKNHINAKTLEKSELILISAKTIHNLVDTSHTFAKRVIEFLANKESSLCKDICSLSLSSTKERLAKYILKEYKRSANAKSFKLSLNQTQLAAFLGTVREVVSRDFASLKKAKLISANKEKLSILDETSLKEIAQGFSKRKSL